MSQKTTPLISQGWLRALLFFIALVLMNFALYFLLYRHAGDADMFPIIPGVTMIIGVIGMAAVLTIMLVFIFCRLIDKIRINEIGLQFVSRSALGGFFLAASLLGLGSMILAISKVLQWTDYNFNTGSFITSIVLMLLVAIGEELAFRGYILRNLMQSFSKPVAIIIGACSFAFMHGANPGMQPMPVINLLLGGVLLGQCYAIDRNIWMPIGFHFAWNFLQGPVLGFRVSGLELISILEQQLTGDQSITGGDFGFEGSFIATLVLLTGIIFMEIRSRKLTGDGKLIGSNS